jgi:hypothetical protein
MMNDLKIASQGLLHSCRVDDNGDEDFRPMKVLLKGSRLTYPSHIGHTAMLSAALLLLLGMLDIGCVLDKEDEYLHGLRCRKACG